MSLQNNTHFTPTSTVIGAYLDINGILDALHQAVSKMEQAQLFIRRQGTTQAAILL